MPIYVEKYVRELGIYGEQCWPKFVSQYTGKVALGYIDPKTIRSVITDPENCKIIIGVMTKGNNMVDGKKYKTVLDPEAIEFLSPDAQVWRDNCQYECFYFSINNVTNEPRGTSDIFVTADWLDAYEQFLFDYADKWPLLNTFVWDMLVTGGDTDTIAEQVKNFTKKSGSIFGHNEKVTLTPSNPKLEAVDAEKGAALLRNHIMSNKSLPEHWYGGGGQVNRATAAEMDAPTYKMMSARQKLVIYIFTCVVRDVIREADLHGMLQGVPDEEKVFTINAPELSAKDVPGFAQAIQQLTTSLVAAETQGWIDRDTAINSFAFALHMIGYEIDVEAMKQKLDEEAATKGYEDYKNTTTQTPPGTMPDPSAPLRARPDGEQK